MLLSLNALTEYYSCLDKLPPPDHLVAMASTNITSAPAYLLIFTFFGPLTKTHTKTKTKTGENCLPPIT